MSDMGTSEDVRGRNACGEADISTAAFAADEISPQIFGEARMVAAEQLCQSRQIDLRSVVTVPRVAVNGQPMPVLDHLVERVDGDHGDPNSNI